MENPISTEETSVSLENNKPENLKQNSENLSILEESSKCNTAVMEILRNAEQHPESLEKHNGDKGEEGLQHEKNTEVSDDSEFGSEITVDAVHQRLTPTFYACEACKQKFDSKFTLKAHFKTGCQLICLTCGYPVYQKIPTVGIRTVRKCKSKCLSNFGLTRPEQ